ncbi:hypothetical protein [Neomegalonema sp.]|uniref:hypothetical protein n=1 Tax=Neomegalonema sp. TaxID=2039713 RepID=UPI00261B1ABC|nr:hypothetical protein [Neomegalonema sp.]MDD2869177.1 hypothetical protein [Neomegalonema sp.]
MRGRGGFLARMGALAAGAFGLLGGCDAYTITRVDSLALMSKGTLYTLSTRGGIPTEIHGTPFAGVEPSEVAARLKLPAGLPAGIRFRAVAPGGFEDEHEKARLVLIFNGASPPGSGPACRLREVAPVNPPQPGGFTLFAVFCDGRNWFGQGFLEARKTAHGDWERFGRLTASLFQEILSQAESARR